MLLFAQILIFILFFVAVTVFTFEATPVVQSGVQHWHHKQLSHLTGILDKMFIFEVSHKKLLLYNVVCICLGALMGHVLTGKVWVAFAGGFIGSVIPNFIAKRLQEMRIEKFRNQLVDMLMLMSGALKAGLNLLQALETVVEEMPKPMSQEVGLLVREIHVGVSLEDAFTHLRKRVNIAELDLITTAIFIARETGGDLTKTFSQLVQSMREKRKLDGKVKALTVQGRMQGIIMSVLPIVFVIMVHQMNKGHFDIMLSDQLGQMLLGAAIFAQIVGMFLISKLSKVDI